MSDCLIRPTGLHGSWTSVRLSWLVQTYVQPGTLTSPGMHQASSSKAGEEAEERKRRAQSGGQG